MPTSNNDVDNKIIAGIVAREGGFVNDPQDKGGRTFEGISEKSNPDAWKNGQPSEAQVRQIYQQRYVSGPGFDNITDTQLRTQLVDYGVLSGPMIAIQKLQGILKIPLDGVLGPVTLSALATVHPEDVNNLLVAARVKMIGQIVVKNPTQLKFLNSWLDRALQFLK